MRRKSTGPSRLRLASERSPEVVFPAEVVERRGEKLQIHNGGEAAAIVEALEGAEFRIASIKKREVRRNAPAPFTTSTLQQEASRKLRLRVRRTMQIAQGLYEGVDLGGSDGTVGLITYMRTDSTRISEQARDHAREFVVQTYGEEFHSGRAHSVPAGAQDAHEAVRPTSVFHTPEKMAGVLKRDELRLYTLIWQRFVASQMAAAVLDQTTVNVGAGEFTFRATGSIVKFAGFTRVYDEAKDEADESAPAKSAAPKKVRLPELENGQRLDRRGLEPKQHFTEPPPRYTEASLVKALEENGIGRPSTYASIVENIQRHYVEQTQQKFAPTEDRHGRQRSLGRALSQDREPEVYRRNGRRPRQGRTRERRLG